MARLTSTGAPFPTKENICSLRKRASASLGTSRVHSMDEIEPRIDQRAIEIEDQEHGRSTMLCGPAHRLAARAGDGLRRGTPAVDIVLHHFPLQGVAMDSEHLGRFRLIARLSPAARVQSCLSPDLHGLLQKQTGLHQIVDKSVKAFFHALSVLLPVPPSPDSVLHCGSLI